jgi:hypothetical protein
LFVTAVGSYETYHLHGIDAILRPDLSYSRWSLRRSLRSRLLMQKSSVPHVTSAPV